jgi:hypothetical protein
MLLRARVCVCVCVLWTWARTRELAVEVSLRTDPCGRRRGAAAGDGAVEFAGDSAVMSQMTVR